MFLKKTIFIISIITLVLLLLVICIFCFIPKTKDSKKGEVRISSKTAQEEIKMSTPRKTTQEETETTVSVETTQEETTLVLLGTKKPEMVVEAFINALIKEDYVTARYCFYTTGDGTFFTAADIEYFVPRSDFVSVFDVGNSYSLSTVFTYTDDNKERGTCTTTVKEGESVFKYSVDVFLNVDGNWLVNEPTFYITNFYLAAPSGKTVVTIDNVIVTQTVGTYGGQGIKTLYCIDCIGRSEKDFAYTSNNFNYVESVFVTENTENEPMNTLIPVADNAVYCAIQNLWNNIYKAYVDEKTEVAFAPFISSSADPSLALVLYKAIDSGTTDPTGSYVDFVCSNVRACNATDYQSYWLSDNRCYVNFNYDLYWTFIAGDSLISLKTMSNSSGLILEKINNEYKLYQLTDGIEFFSWAKPKSAEIK